MPAEEHLQYVPQPPGVPLRVAIGAAAASILLLAVAIGAFHAIYNASVPVKVVPAPQGFPQPQVTTSAAERAQLRRLDQEQMSRLNSWRWADANHTLVQVPIDRAMQLLAAKGADAWAPLLAAQPDKARSSENLRSPQEKVP
jgi:hypothetical protein